MKTAKFYGTVYEVKPTGEFINRPARCFGDINGGIVNLPASQTPILGLFDAGELKYSACKRQHDCAVLRQ